ncbi:hypothetical protein CY658_24290 [Variovorax sp. RO1]|uniref:DUF4145 domain-containing protein n=1 Tax=Variovorax sp. RO1 TaxID=2066034 RepID=UPI000C718004|nr:DUF4145 domain-containing protein [Variovorax sp. RO1]PLC03014.1 hypothetical protein CY658_24290 [Variovorax sp. RO1]
MASDTLVLNKLAGQELDVQCSRCTGITSHLILANANASGGDPNYQWDTDHQILQCRGCKTLSFRSAASNSEDIDHWYDENGELQSEYAILEKLYPPRISDYVGLKTDLWLLPDKLRSIYQETSQALTAQQPVLTGIGVRAILETLCKDKAAAGKTLFDQIDDLVKKQLLTPARAAILHQIRTLGNKSAHEVAPHTPPQLSLAMSVVDHLLEEVYIIPNKAQQQFASFAPPPAAASLPPLPPPSAAAAAPALPNGVQPP